MRGKWLLFSVSAVLVGVAVGAVSLLRRQPAGGFAARRQDAQPAAPVEVTLPARIQARQVVAVKAPFAGTVVETSVEAGQEVYEGQLMARISNQGLEGAQEGAKAAVESAQARVTKAESAMISARMEASRARADAQRSHQEFERADKVYRRQKFLLSEGATPRLVYEKYEREFQNAETELNSLETLAKHAEERVDALIGDVQAAKKVLEEKTRQMENTQADLKSGEVHAPVEGLVVTRKTEAGKALEEGQSMDLFEIAVNPSALEAVVEADPSALKRLRTGGAAVLFFADMPNEGVPAAIREVRGDRVFLDFTSPDPLAIKHGITAQARLRLE